MIILYSVCMASPIGLLQFIVVLVVLVLAVGNDARRRRHREETLHHLDVAQRGFEGVDVLRELGLAGIGDGADGNRIHDRLDLVAGIEIGVEFRKARAVGAAGERIAGDRA